MLDLLHAAERALPDLLARSEGWMSLDIDYHPPRVERLYRPFGEGRLMLHRIARCEPEQALLHPHPWPCAVRIVAGTYEMRMGYGAGTEPPAIAVRMILGGGTEYEMTDPDAWHTVCPRDPVVYSVMVTGAPWSRAPARPSGPLGPLPDAVAESLRGEFRRWYG